MASSIDGEHGTTSATLHSISTKDDSSDSAENFDLKSGPLKKRFSVPWTRKRQSKTGNVRELGPKGITTVYRPPEPLIDIIFVHGLRGGSVKSWQKGGDSSRFWPQLWLPVESGFEHANIHSFGYDADIKTGNEFNIHDFGRELLEEMRIAPHLTDDDQRPIIMIGHSMGGLVIKKAFILAHDLAIWKHRIRCIFFLATPHRGSNYASILKNLFVVSGTATQRQYVSDLTTSSQTLRLINDDFGKKAHEIFIYSFFETLKTKIGPSSLLIVDKESAILGPGFRNERVKSVAASHCDISKFKSPEDPNYILIRNGLATAARELLKDVLDAKEDKQKLQMTVIKPYLDIFTPPEEHINIAEGSCEWINAREDFQEWHDSPEAHLAAENAACPPTPKLSIYWVHASPGSGKSCLASYVHSYLESNKAQCCHYYFHIGNQTSRSLAPFLRSIAFQMALSSTVVREKIYKLYQDGSIFDADDSWTIWTKLFKKGILQIESETPQYWILDAIDECPRYSELFTMLKGERPRFPLRIFITSRPIRDMQRLQNLLKPTALVTCIEIPLEDSLNDIRFYVKNRVEGMLPDDDASALALVDNILAKSNACFLWVRLVLDELDGVFTTSSRIDILNTMPEGMKPYYARAMEPIESNIREKHISKAVFTWIVTASRTLSIDEIVEALRHDISADIPQTSTAIEGLCGQLVHVNVSLNTVDLIHPTAREFLLSAAGEFTISLPKAHERLALVCLKLLSSNELRPPRTSRALTHARPILSPLCNYAILHFSEHIFAASSENDELLLKLNHFFKTNVFSWIERVAISGNLHILLRVCKNLKAYLDRRAKYLSPVNAQVHNIDKWTVDLNRLVTQFGEPLLKQPSSIYYLVPPLCPSETAISQHFGKRSDGLVFTGRRSVNWNDCVANISLQQDIAATVACGDTLFAVGTESGTINLYSQRSFQRESSIKHRHPIDLMHITDSWIICSTTTSLIMQDISGSIIWENRLRFRCLALAASETCVVAVSQHGHLIKWDRKTGEIIEDRLLQYQNYDVETLHNHRKNRAPIVAAFSADCEMVVLGYRGGTVSLWDAHDGEQIGWARDERGRIAGKLIFNPNSNIRLLLAIYSDHGLSLYDTWSTELVQSQPSPTQAGFLSASCSPDGRTLATTDTRGNMHIWDFETLTILYHILSPYPSFRILSFISDGSSVLDVMDSDIRVWAPSVLVRKTFEEDASISDDVIPLPVDRGEYKASEDSQISAVSVHPSLPLAVIGKTNGDLIACQTNKEGARLPLHCHKDTVVAICVSKGGVVASFDVRNVVRVREYEPRSGKSKKIKGIDGIKPAARVKQILFSVDGAFLLISTERTDVLYSCRDGHCVGMNEFEPASRKVWTWLAFEEPNSGCQQYWLIADRSIFRYSATSFPEQNTVLQAILCYSLSPGCQEKEILRAALSKSSAFMTLEISFVVNASVSSTVLLFSLADIAADGMAEEQRQLHNVLSNGSKRCRHFLGWTKDNMSMVVMDEDSWVSSIPLTKPEASMFYRHFYIPRQLSADSTPIKTATDDIVLCNAGELTSIGSGLKFVQADKFI